MMPLDDLVLVDGFEKEGSRERLEQFARDFDHEIRHKAGSENGISRVHILPSILSEVAGMNPIYLARVLRKQIDGALKSNPLEPRQSEKSRMVIGFSFGGLILLSEEVDRIKRRESPQFNHVVCVNSPLNPGVEVPPPPFGDFGEVYGGQYDARPFFAKGVADHLRGMSFEDRSRITSIGTVDGDPFVPTPAKRLDGVIRFASIPEVQGHGLSDEMIHALVKHLVGICMSSFEFDRSKKSA